MDVIQLSMWRRPSIKYNIIKYLVSDLSIIMHKIDKAIHIYAFIAKIENTQR